jgi:PAS domain S-box-containing protein
MNTVDFSRVFERLPSPYMLLDRELRYVAANAAYRRVTSSTMEQLRGRHIIDVFPDDGRDESENAQLLARSLQRVVETGEPDTLAHIPYKVSRVPGGPPELRIWSATHTPILDDEGRVAFVLQHTEDVTELHVLRDAVADDTHRTQLEAGVLQRAERVQATNLTLEAEREYFRSLFRQAPGFVCVLRGPTHIVELANAAYYLLVGDRPLEGRSIIEALPELAGQGYVERLDQVFTTGQTFVGKALPVVLQRPGQTTSDRFILDFVYQPIFDARGQVTGIFVQGHDITEQKRLEEELAHLLARERSARADAESARAQAERANVLKDEFLATLSHELRTPLNALLGWTRLLRAGRLAADDAARAVHTVERNALALAQLVDDVLDLSRIVTGKLRLRVAPCDMAEVIARAIDTVMPAARARDVTLEQGPLPPAAIMGDPDRLQQVVWNLLTNAVKFTPAGGTVHVSLVLEEGRVLVEVRDTGVGIDPAFLPLIFDRFRQVNPAFDRHHGGLGVGLALVRQLVSAHGGDVEAHSDGPGTGATFRVRLPVRAIVAVDAEGPRRLVTSDAGDAEVEPASLDGLRVLVVEDNPDARQLMEHVLDSAGARTTVASTAPEALELLWASPPDVLVSDLGLPGMDGLELMRQLRAEAPRPGSDVPAIAVTAYARASDREHALRAGYQMHMAKPVPPHALASAIAALVHTRSTRGDRQADVSGAVATEPPDPRHADHD